MQRKSTALFFYDDFPLWRMTLDLQNDILVYINKSGEDARGFF